MKLGILRKNGESTDNEIRNIVKYNQDGREIKDNNYVDFLVERYKDNKNISGVEANTKNIKKMIREKSSRNEVLQELIQQIEQPKKIELKVKLKNEQNELEDVSLKIDITMTGLKESFNKGQSIEKFAIVPYLDKIILSTGDGNGYFVLRDDKQRTDVKGYYYLFNTANIDGKLHGIKIDIKKSKAGDRFYVHRVKLINNEGASIQANNSLELEVPVGQEAPSINNSITQTTKNVKQNTTVNNKSAQKSQKNVDNGVRYLKKSASTQPIEVDNKGRKLTKQQQEYFKNSKARNNKGELEVVYHGTNKAGFTEFNRNYNYFTNNKEVAQSYTAGIETVDTKRLESISDAKSWLKGINGDLYINDTTVYDYDGETLLKYENQEDLLKNLKRDIQKEIGSLDAGGTYQGYVNITKPITIDAKNEIWSMIDINNISIEGINSVEEFLKKYGSSVWKEKGKLRTSTADIVSAISDAIDNGELDADGIIIKNIYDEGGYGNITPTESGTDYITFNSNQFKALDNISPTTNSDIRYLKKGKSVSTAKRVTDNQGRELSKQQEIYFQNSIVRDEKGNLKTLYHGTSADFTVFDYKYLGKNGTSLGKGFYLTDDINTAKGYAERENGKVMEVYADIQKPLSYGKKTMSANEYIQFVEAVNDATDGQLFGDYSDGEKITRDSSQYNEMIKQFKQDYSYGGDDIDLVSEILNSANLSLKKGYKILRDTLGYDGVVSDKGYLTENGTVYVPFLSEQIKNIDNKKPTDSEDIRHKKKTSKAEPGQTNAERLDAYIEQEIKKIEETASWDNSIPVTKRTDIRKTIEDYLGIGVRKGHFRQVAYGIYNTNNDTIRTKELKDIDTILHETGHALDIGNRLNIDKESIADELLTAISKIEGYEDNPRSIKLEEGFAEIIREYAILPEQTLKEYPKTVAVLEGIRDTDKSFDDFIGNIQKQVYNYIHQNPRNRVLSNQSIGEQTDKAPITKDRIKENIIKLVWDRDYALKSAVNEISKVSGKTVDSSKNAYLLTRLASGVYNKAISMISDGYIDLDGKKTIPGLNSLGDILGDNPERWNDLRANLAANRDLDYKSKTMKSGMRSMDTKAVREQFKNDVQIQKASKIVYDTLDGVLQYVVDNGLITSVNADQLRQSNAFYVPFQRVVGDNKNQVGRRGAVADIIKTRRGSELDTKDILENIVVNSANMIQQVENNNVLRALYEQGEEAGIKHHIFEKIPTPLKKVGTAQLSTWENELNKQGVDTSKIDLEKTIDIFAPNNKIDTNNLITSFIDEEGNRVYLQFAEGTEDIFNTIMNLDKNTNSAFLKLMRNMNMPLRYGATMANIGFSIPNMISDTAQAAIFSEAGFIPVLDNALGVLDILTANNKTVAKFMEEVAPEYAKRVNTLYTMYEQSGATSATRLSQYRKSAQELMKDVYGTKNSETLGIKETYKPLKRLLDLMTYIPELSEQSTRFRVFERNYEAYKNKGSTEMEARLKAALESRDATQDFGRTGTFMREVNQLIPFSAARVGSSYTFTEKIKANPKRTMTRIAILTAIAMTIKAIGYDDKEIEELNQRKKDDNFVLKVGDKVITLKKPQGILRSIINLAEYIQDLATGHIEEGKEGKKLAEWVNNAIMDNMPADSVSGLVPNAVAPVIENAINKDFYYNTDIVKSYDLDLPNSEQYYDYNSQLAIWLGKIFNYSPAKIDNLISGYFGGLGTQVTNIIDWISGKVGLSAEKPDMGAEQNAVGKRFIVNVNTNSASIDEIYDRKDELTKKKNGGTITDKELEELETITAAITNLSKLNKQIKTIKKDLTLSGKEKAELIRPLQEQKTDTARQALGKDLIYEENANKIESNQFYPTNDSLKNNGYTLTLTEEMKKEYESLAYETYTKYKKQGLYAEDKLKSIAKDYAKKSLLQKYKKQLTKSK